VRPPSWLDVLERWQLDPGLLLGLALTVTLYLLGVRRAGRRGGSTEAVGR